VRLGARVTLEMRFVIVVRQTMRNRRSPHRFREGSTDESLFEHRLARMHPLRPATSETFTSNGRARREYSERSLTPEIATNGSAAGPSIRDACERCDG
jgi:hypothetical protein